MQAEALKDEVIPKYNFQLVAMAAVLISSKYEDRVTINAQKLLDKAGHDRFIIDELFMMEKDIL
jgi:Cyclin, N-terminal domain